MSDTPQPPPGSEQTCPDALAHQETPPLPPINLLTIGAVMSAALWIGRYELERRLVL